MKAKCRRRCSRCRSERYCGRECQVKHWPGHKEACNAKKKKAEEEDEEQEQEDSDSGGTMVSEIVQ